MLRENPNFDYSEFKSKSDFFHKFLSEFVTFRPRAKSTLAFFELLRATKDTLKMLRFMTPFYIEVLAREFSRNAPNADSDAECSKLTYATFVYVFRDDSLSIHPTLYGRCAKWCSETLSKLFDHISRNDPLIALETLRAEFNSAAPSTMSFDFDFSPKLRLFSRSAYTFEDDLFKALLSYVEPLVNTQRVIKIPFDTYQDIKTAFGFLGVLTACLLNQRESHISSVVQRPPATASAFLQSRSYIAASQNEFGFYTIENGTNHHLEALKLFKRIFVKTSSIQTLSPIWNFLDPLRIEFFKVSIHQTYFFDGDVEITAADIQTKLLDYEYAPNITYEIPMQTTSLHDDPLPERALIYSWSYNELCTKSVPSYGSHRFYLFSNASLECYHKQDEAIETITLLQEIVEVIPCVFLWRGRNGLRAYFGLNLERSAPLFEVDLAFDGTKLECSVLDLICEYLESDLYSPSDILNKTICPI